jgi:hypothetical protein
MFIEKVKILEMLFAAVTHIVEGLNLETLLTLRVEKYLICLVGRRGPTLSITEQSVSSKSSDMPIKDIEIAGFQNHY